MRETQRPLIGLAGKKGSGKDTVGRILAEHCGYRRQAFADALKREVVHTILRASTTLWERHTPRTLLEYIEAHKHDLLDSPTGWPRQLLQAWGTMRRDLCGEDYWIRELSLEPGVVVTDVRHQNEVTAIRVAGGVIWWVERPALADGADTHLSEQQVTDLDADCVVLNAGTLADLEQIVRDLGTERP